MAEATPEGEEAWVADQLSSPPSASTQVLGGAPETCTPGYYNQEGTAKRYRDNRLETYPRGLEPYRDVLRGWLEEGSMAGLATR